MNFLKQTLALVAMASTLAAPASAQDFMLPQTAADTDDVYFLAQLKLTDMEAFQQTYIPGVSPLLTEVGARVLAVSPVVTALEGQWDTNWTVLMRFDDQATFDAFYYADNYQDELVPLRQSITDINNLILLPAFDPETFFAN